MCSNKVKQVNNIGIYIAGGGYECRHNKVVLEHFKNKEDAIKWAKETKDFIKKRK